MHNRTQYLFRPTIDANKHPRAHTYSQDQLIRDTIDFSKVYNIIMLNIDIGRGVNAGNDVSDLKIFLYQGLTETFTIYQFKIMSDVFDHISSILILITLQTTQDDFSRDLGLIDHTFHAIFSVLLLNSIIKQHNILIELNKTENLIKNKLNSTHLIANIDLIEIIVQDNTNNKTELITLLSEQLRMTSLPDLYRGNRIDLSLNQQQNRNFFVGLIKDIDLLLQVDNIDTLQPLFYAMLLSRSCNGDAVFSCMYH